MRNCWIADLIKSVVSFHRFGGELDWIQAPAVAQLELLDHRAGTCRRPVSAFASFLQNLLDPLFLPQNPSCFAQTRSRCRFRGGALHVLPNGNRAAGAPIGVVEDAKLAPIAWFSSHLRHKRPHECGRGTQECVRHALIRQPAFEAVAQTHADAQPMRNGG